MSESIEKLRGEYFKKWEDGSLSWNGRIHYAGTPIKIADFWLSKIAEREAELKQEVADKLKHKFNGFGGTLGFTLQELLSLLQVKEIKK